MQFGLSLPLSYNIRQLIDLASKAENVGFDYVFMPDHIMSLDDNQPLNVWSVLNILAVSTYKIGLGSMVANIYRQHPSTLRQQVYTLRQSLQLHSIVRRNLIIGLGAGMAFDCEPFGIKRKHVLGRMRASTFALFGLRGVPVIMGAYGLEMKKMATECDGWVSRHALSPTEFGKERYEVKQYLGTADEEYLYIADIPVSHADEPWLWKTLAYRYLLQTKYRDKSFNYLTKSGIEKDSCLVPRSTLEGFSAVGSNDEIIGKLESYVESGANMFSIRYYGEDLEKFGEVMDYFRDRCL